MTNQSQPSATGTKPSAFGLHPVRRPFAQQSNAQTAAQSHVGSNVLTHPQLGPAVFSFLPMQDLITLTTVSKTVRQDVMAADQVWADICERRWTTSQKTYFMRYWWKDLSHHQKKPLATNAVTMTAGEAIESPHPLRDPDQHKKAMNFFAGKRRGRKEDGFLPRHESLEVMTTWYERCRFVEADAYREFALKDEICFDHLDPDACPTEVQEGFKTKKIAFPLIRRWRLLVPQTFDYSYGEECMFFEDFTCKMGSNCTFPWRFRNMNGKYQIVVGRTQKLRFDIARSADFGFVLTDKQKNVTLCSREKSMEEHVYRLLRRHIVPPSLEKMVAE
jgi:hypothetical protein